MNLLVSGGNHEEAGTDNQTQETMNEQPQSESVHSLFINYLNHSAISKLTGGQNKLVCENHS